MGRYIYLILPASKKLPPNRSIFAFFDGQLLNGLNKIIRDFLRNRTVMFVARVLSHKLADPPGSSPEGTVGTLSDQVEVAGQEASRLDVHIDAVEIRFDQRNESGERPVRASVDNIRDTHQLVFGLDWTQRGRWRWCVDR